MQEVTFRTRELISSIWFFSGMELVVDVWGIEKFTGKCCLEEDSQRIQKTQKASEGYESNTSGENWDSEDSWSSEYSPEDSDKELQHFQIQKTRGGNARLFRNTPNKPRICSKRQFKRTLTSR